MIVNSEQKKINKELKFTLNMENEQESTLHPIDPVFKLSARDYE